MEFVIQDIHKNKFKVSYTAQQFKKLHDIFGEHCLYEFILMEKTYDRQRKKSYSLTEAFPYEEKNFTLKA